MENLVPVVISVMFNGIAQMRSGRSLLMGSASPNCPSYSEWFY